MKAVQFNFTIPRYVVGMALGKLHPAFYWSGLSCTTYEEAPGLRLPGEDWVLIKTRFGGICSSDMSVIQLKPSTDNLPFISYPYTFGHENVGHIVEVGQNLDNWQIGERVVVEPTLWCAPRGFEELCRFCARGEINRCERFTEGNLEPGYSLGLCADTGGSWGSYYLAHKSQLYRVPDQISDENALMVELFATGLHAVLDRFPADDETVLIIGAGTIGLCTLAALRTLGSRARILVQARYPFQAEAARKLGASEIITGGRDNNHYETISQVTGAKYLRPILGKSVIVGGVDITYECVGSAQTVEDATRLTRNGGQVLLLGSPGIVKGMDWTQFLLRELDLKSVYIYNHAETYQGETWKTFDLAIDLMARGEVDLGWLVTHRFELDDYKRAFRMMGKRRENQAIKAVFDFRDGNDA